ncbi:hypothetical protein [Nocardiopsis sp. CC223A]|nr:hypothetical protein [Nocardiopsis sp. CC223A]
MRWPGPDGVVEWSSVLRREWAAVSPDDPAPFPWPEGPGMSVVSHRVV